LQFGLLNYFGARNFSVFAAEHAKNSMNSEYSLPVIFMKSPQSRNKGQVKI